MSVDFRIRGLQLEPFRALFGLDDAALAARGARRVVADSKPGYPDRIALRDAEPGETLLLVHHEHHSANTPFRASHAVYVVEAEAETFDAVNRVPALLRNRTLSLRAFDAGGMMLDADLVEGAAMEGLVERMFSEPKVSSIHVHYAKPGCYACSIERA